MRWLGLLVLLLASACVRRVPLPEGTELFRAKTNDGWSLELVRYRPQGEPTGRPVLLLHGLGANARNLDIDEDHSLARWFTAHGREAWTLSLRGTGSSDGPDSASRHAGYPFDAYWQEDLPAALAEIRVKAGVEQVDFVGHSMGGLVLYAYLSQGGQGIAAAATLGSPTRLDWGTQLEPLLVNNGSLLAKESAIPLETSASLFAPIQGTDADLPLQRYFYEPSNTSVLTWQRLMAYGTADLAGGVLHQFRGWMEAGTFASVDGRLDFRKDLAKVTTPVLVVAARLDRIALLPGVRDGYRALGGPKQWLLVCPANGAGAEYGHMDLVVGDHAPKDVWTKVLAFFDKQR